MNTIVQMEAVLRELGKYQFPQFFRCNVVSVVCLFHQ